MRSTWSLPTLAEAGFCNGRCKLHAIPTQMAYEDHSGGRATKTTYHLAVPCSRCGLIAVALDAPHPSGTPVAQWVPYMRLWKFAADRKTRRLARQARRKHPELDALHKILVRVNVLTRGYAAVVSDDELAALRLAIGAALIKRMGCTTPDYLPLNAYIELSDRLAERITTRRLAEAKAKARLEARKAAPAAVLI